MPTPPFQPPPGQAVAWAYPSSLAAYKSALLTPMSVGDAAFDFVLNLSDAHAIRLESGLLIEQYYRIRFSGFSAPSLPFDAGSVSGIYPVAVAGITGTPITFVTLGFVNGATEVDLFSTSTATFPLKYFSGSSLGTNLADVASIYADITTSGTTSGAGHCDCEATFVGLAIYYDAPIMPIGHGANCNAYDPITLEAGSASAPGNGILIS